MALLPSLRIGCDARGAGELLKDPPCRGCRQSVLVQGAVGARQQVDQTLGLLRFFEKLVFSVVEVALEAREVALDLFGIRLTQVGERPARDFEIADLERLTCSLEQAGLQRVEPLGGVTIRRVRGQHAAVEDARVLVGRECVVPLIEVDVSPREDSGDLLWAERRSFDVRAVRKLVAT